MTAPERENWLKDQLWRAINAQTSLSAAKKQRVSEYDERLRELKGFAQRLQVIGNDSQQGELFDAAELLSPRIQRLLDSPTRGLA